MKKLNHPPFNDWLLSEAQLTPEQNHQLVEHLHICPECEKAHLALTEVKLLFRSAGQSKPSTGFTSRWEKRLSTQREARKRRNAWVLFGMAAVMAGVILTILLWRVFGLFNSPALFLSALVYLWTYSQVFLKDLAGLLQVSYRFLPSISILGLVFFAGFCSFISVLWFVTYRKLTIAGRVASW